MNTASRVFHRPDCRCLCLLLVFPCIFLLVGCDANPSSSNHPGCSSTTLTGAGSTFDAPLFTKLFAVYPPTVACGLTVNYYPVGSGAGAAQLLTQQADFGATDAPLTDRQLASSPNGAVLHIPVALGAVAVGYHLTEIASPLRLSGEVVAKIYLGQVTTWDDPSIAHLNPGISLPHRPIQVIHRSDSSGTTAIFTHYLTGISPQWKSKVGASTSVSWPVGVGEQGSGGVADALTNREGSLGYVEWSYVVHQHLSAALIQNAKGAFLAPSIAGAQAAAASFPMPADLRLYIVNAPGSAAYPITGYSWIVVYRHQNDGEKGQALAQLLWWMTHEGQQYAEPLQYAPLPAEIVSKGEAQIRFMTCGTGSTPCFTR